jgi:glycosyltransferase involved in cell wall biosynthesis
VCTRANNRAAIEAALEPSLRDHLRLVYYDLPPVFLRWKRGVLGVRAYYVLWQIGLLRTARRLQQEVGFDVVHHLTFNSMDMPGFLWLLGPGFVWGPVGGGQEANPALRAYFGSRWLRERLRTLRKRAARLNPLVRAAVRRAAAVLVANTDTARQLPISDATRLVRELETAVDLPAPPSATAKPEPRTVFTVLWIGSLVLLKAPRLALEALAELKRLGVDFRAVFVGDGELAEAMRAWVRALDLDREVELVGPVPYTDVGRWYAMGDAFLFTGLHDTSGNVVLEAMACGLPVVTLDQHGVGEMVEASCGVKVPIVHQRQVVADLAAALAWLAADPDQRRRMGEAGRRRVEREYTWDRKGELLRTLYAEVGGAARAASGSGGPGWPATEPEPRSESDAHAPTARP